MESTGNLKYQTALRKARKPPLNYFHIFGLAATIWTVLWLLGVLFIFRLPVICAFVFLCQRFNQRKIKERLLEAELLRFE